MITELFKKRLIAFYSSWRTHRQLWGNSDIVVFSTPAQAASNLRSSSTGDFFLWLVGEDLAGTTAVFTPSSIFFLCTQKSFALLRSLGGYATEVMKIPVSVELKPRSPDELGLSKLDGIIRSMRLRLNSGKSLFAADLTCTLTVGCIDHEIPKSKLLLSCVNGFEYFAKYRIANVNSGVRKLIALSDSRISKNDNLLADNVQFNRGVKRTMEDRIDAMDKAKLPSLSLGKLENSNLIKGFKDMNVSLGEAETSSKANTDEELILENLGEKFEKAANEPPLVVDQRKTTEPMMEGETSYVSFSLEKGTQMQCYNEWYREFKQQCIDKQPETEKNGSRKDKKAARMGLSVPEQRLTFFYSSWRKYRHELWGDSDVLVVTTPPSSSSGSMALATMLDHPVSSSFFLWLLGRDFPNTTAVFMDRAIYFFCPIESYSELCFLGLYMTTAAQVSVSVQQKVKGGDESELLNSTLDALWTDRANDLPVTIGYIDGEAPSSKVLDSCVAGKSDERMFLATNVISGFLKLLYEEGDGLKSLQSRSLGTTEDKDIENLAENYQQAMSLSYCNDAKASSVVSNEQQKDELLQEKHENKDELQKPEEANQLLQEGNGKIGNLPSKFAEMNIVVEGEKSHHSTEEDGSESKLLVAEKEQESQSGNVRDDGNENACKQSKESVGSDDDDWEIIENRHEGQEPDIANNSSWRSWIGRAFSSVSLHQKAAGDEASS